MPYPVQNLINGRSDPVWVGPNEPAQRALALMHQHDFSQLPVVDNNLRPLGMINHESILRALNHFGVGLEGLRVADAIVKAPVYRPDDDLSDVLDRLRDANAVLIVDAGQKLIGIITSYDSNEFFRRRAEDMLLVEDIETMLKDLILTVHIGADGETDTESLQHAIGDITGSAQDLKKKYRKALVEYLKESGLFEWQINVEAMEHSASLLLSPQKPKEFDQLTLSEYISLLLHPKHWQKYAPMLMIEPGALQRMLDAVRETRNELAHFRGEITPEQRDQLRFCSEWLDRHRLAIPVNLPSHVPTSKQEQATTRDAPAQYLSDAESKRQFIPTDEMTEPNESRYAPLGEWLSGRPGSEDRVQVTFSEIEAIINSELPASARRHRAWWANDATSHSHSQEWLNAGWRVSYINMQEEKITFARIIEREKTYIHFFSQLLARMGQRAKFPFKKTSPDGHSWIVVGDLPESGPQLAVLSFSFARRQRFRVELYIDMWEKEKNKRAFDELYSQRNDIENALGAQLSWERIDNRRACRIALYHAGSITDSKNDLSLLIDWAVDWMNRFYNSLEEPASRALLKAYRSETAS